jgi:hypothetical protein
VPPVDDTGARWVQRPNVPRSSVIALVWILAFAVFAVVDGAIGAVVLALGGVAMCAASWLSRRAAHGRYTVGSHPYPYWMWSWVLLAMGLLSFAIAAAELT